MSAHISESIKRHSCANQFCCDRFSVAAFDQNITDSLMVISHWQDAIPRSIWVDPALDAVDVRSWGVMRTQAASGSAGNLSLNQLLKDQLHYSKATISKVIYVLRLTRWISLCSKPSSSETGPQGNQYTVHDTPCTINDAIHLDAHYLAFVKKQLTHTNKQISNIAQWVWKSIQASVAHDEHFLAQKLSGATSSFIKQLNKNVNTIQYFNRDKKHHIHRVQKMNPVIKNSENNKKQSLDDQVHYLNLGNDVGSSLLNLNNNKTTTTNLIRFEKESDLKIPLIFPNEFNASEIKLAELYLKRVETELQQAFLDETAAKIETKRKTSNPVRNPIGYLAWLCNAHTQGLTALTSLSIRYAEKRERELKMKIENQPGKPKERINPRGQVADKSRTQSVEDYKSRIIDLRASLNLSKNNHKDGCAHSAHNLN